MNLDFRVELLCDVCGFPSELCESLTVALCSEKVARMEYSWIRTIISRMDIEFWAPWCRRMQDIRPLVTIFLNGASQRPVLSEFFPPFVGSEHSGVMDPSF